MSLSELEFTNSTGYEAGGKPENKNALPFITILALMLEAERTPIQVSDTSGVKNKHNNKPAKNENNGWIERRIYIDTRYKSDAAKGDHKPFDKEGKRLEKVYIQGFLRNQPYGAGQKLRKWIYVEGFASTRWKREGDTRVIVSMRNQKGDSH
jgi:hypothetical protein